METEEPAGDEDCADIHRGPQNGDYCNTQVACGINKLKIKIKKKKKRKKKKKEKKHAGQMRKKAGASVPVDSNYAPM